MEWTKQQYNKQYENWMPWVEDKYLQWFTNDNKASYTTKGESILIVGTIRWRKNDLHLVL